MMRDWSLISAALVVALTTLSAQQARTGMISGRAMDRSEYPLPGVTVTVAGAIRQEVVTSSDGGYRLANLPAGRYTMTAELAGFVTEQHTVDVGAGETRTFDLLLRGPCLGESNNPPLTVYFPFAQMLRQADGAAYVRIREAGGGERLLTDMSCLSVRPYIAEPLALINVADAPGNVGILRFYGRSWDPGLTPGDEAIVFLWREQSTGTYHEMDDRYRMPISNGRVNAMQMEWPPVRNGGPVDEVLNKIRVTMSQKSPQP